MSEENNLLANNAPRWLPGIMAIGTFLLLRACVVLFLATTQPAPATQRVCYGALGVMLLCGSAGLLALRRWGWALATAGSVVLLFIDSLAFFRLHQANWMVFAIADIVFFLYLVRASVRERMR